jgi:hypothetical protein
MRKSVKGTSPSKTPPKSSIQSPAKASKVSKSTKGVKFQAEVKEESKAAARASSRKKSNTVWQGKTAPTDDTLAEIEA